MKTKLISISLIALLTVGSLPALAKSIQPVDSTLSYREVVETPEARLAAAKRNMKSGMINEMINTMTSEVSAQPGIPAGEVQQVSSQIQSTLDTDALEEIILQKLAEHFTAAELNALADFNESPEGQAINKKMPTFAIDTVQASIPVVMQAVFANSNLFAAPAATQEADADNTPAAESDSPLPH